MVEEQKQLFEAIFNSDENERAFRSLTPCHVLNSNYNRTPFPLHTGDVVASSVFSTPTFGVFPSQVQREVSNRFPSFSGIPNILSSPNLVEYGHPRYFAHYMSPYPSPSFISPVPHTPPSNLLRPLPRRPENKKYKSYSLSNWYLKCVTLTDNKDLFPPGTEVWIILSGIIKKSGGQSSRWHSTPILDRIDQNLVKTDNNKFYKLEGDISIKDMITNGFSQELCDKFHRGFPNDWKEILHNEFKSAWFSDYIIPLNEGDDDLIPNIGKNIEKSDYEDSEDQINSDDNYPIVQVVIDNSNIDIQSDNSNKEEFGSTNSNDELQLDSSDKEEIDSTNSNNDELQLDSYNKEEIDSTNPNDDELQLDSFNKEEIDSTNPSNDELHLRSELQLDSSNKEEIDSANPNNDMLQLDSFNKKETNTTNPNNDELQLDVEHNEKRQLLGKRKSSKINSKKKNTIEKNNFNETVTTSSGRHIRRPGSWWVIRN
ncbi:SANT associated-domain-containing protein [Gigaspora rosea]|uniref:SANT associated-domain-containing protein n=1 Tax=Gigaspora rosea TaxID=44941 RepID=A0A397VMA6_9GLOM|nr:SANT associated-domain-containing protein [Gigaspora rosea]